MMRQCLVAPAPGGDNPVMKQQCPECRTVARTPEPYCTACGHDFGRDRLRDLASHSRKDWAVAVCAGLVAAVVEFFVSR
jgi:uncharacterized protein (DUF983 family)